MTKKLLSLLSIFILAFAFISCSSGEVDYTTTEITKTNDDSQFDFESNVTVPELDVDGLDDDEEWNQATSELTYGNNGNVTMKMYLGEEALFVYFEVLDTNIMTLGYNNGDDVTRSDSVEFYIDTDNDATNSPQAGDYQINIGAHGKARVLSGSGGSWGTWNGMIDYSVVVNGTINDASDTDTSYTIELMLPYRQIELSDSSVFGFSLGHVDKETEGDIPGEDFGWYGYVHNGQFTDPQIPSSYIVCLDGEYYNRNAMPLENIEVSGIVKDSENNPLEGVVVTIDGTEKTSTTNAQGEYSFTDVNRNTGFTINATKDGFIDYTVTYTRLELESLDALTNNFSMIDANTAQYTDITLNVVNVLNPIVEGVTVSVVGTTINGTSSAQGEVSIADVPVTSTITLLLEKDGYQSKEVVIETSSIVVDGITALGSVEMYLAPGETIIFAGARGINGFETELVRGIDGIYITFVTDTAFEPTEAIEMFIDTGASGTARDTSDYRVNFGADGTVTVWQWGNDVFLDLAGSTISSTVTPDGDGAIVEGFIPYELLGLTSNDIFGVSFGCWSGVLSDWDGWGYDGFIAPEIPTAYVRIGLDNTLYKADSNASVVTISGNVALEGVTVTIGSETVQTDTLGNYSIIVNEDTSYDVVFTMNGYTSQTVTLAPVDFTGGVATVDVSMTPYYNSLSGTINEDGVTVTVVDGTITDTSASGTYLLENLPTYEALTITFEKEGFVTITLNLTVEQLNGAAIVENITMISSTTVGTINGTVSSYEGLVEGATVSVVGETYTTTTNALGEFSFVDIVQDNYTILVTYAGYEDLQYDIQANEYDTTHSLVITKAPGLTGVFSGKDTHPSFDPIEAAIVRETTGVRVTFTTTESFDFDGTNREVIEFFIDTGVSGTSRDTTDYLIMLRSDGSIGIVNWASGGNEDPSTLIFTHSAQEMEVFIPYAFLGIQADEIFGVSMGQWSEYATDWDGWVFNGTFVAPENPQAYVRVGEDNQLYEDSTNYPVQPIPGETGLFATKTTHEAFDSISGFIYREATGIRFIFTTEEEFAFDGTNKEVIELFIDTGVSGTSRDTTDYLFMLRSDGTIGIVNWASGGNEDPSTLTFTFSSQEMELFIPYAFLGITENDIFGISLGEWNDFASDWDGWAYNDTFIDPANPQGYVRVGLDNLLYEANNNDPLAVPGETGLFATKTTHEAFDSISGFIYRETTGIRFIFTTEEEFQFDGTNMDKIELFIDTGVSGTTRDTSDYLFILKSDGTVQIVNWESGGNEDTSTLTFTYSAQEMELFIPYAFLGIQADDIFGVSMGEWSDFAADWDGWSYDGVFIDPANPQGYVRVGLDNLLYVANNNDPVVNPGLTGAFATKTTHEAFDAIEGSIVRSDLGITFTFTTQEEFQFDGTNMDKIELFIDTGITGTTRDASDYLFILKSDGTVQIVNWASGGNEDPSTIVFTYSAQQMEVFIPYAFLGIQPDDVFGISLGEWSDFAADWDGWSYDGVFIDPANPTLYIRVGADNQLYVDASN